MRKFFLVLSVLVLVILISIGIYYRVEDSRTESLKTEELSQVFTKLYI